MEKAVCCHHPITIRPLCNFGHQAEMANDPPHHSRANVSYVSTGKLKYKGI